MRAICETRGKRREAFIVAGNGRGRAVARSKRAVAAVRVFTRHCLCGVEMHDDERQQSECRDSHAEAVRRHAGTDTLRGVGRVGGTKIHDGDTVSD